MVCRKGRHPFNSPLLRLLVFATFTCRSSQGGEEGGGVQGFGLPGAGAWRKSTFGPSPLPYCTTFDVDKLVGETLSWH